MANDNGKNGEIHRLAGELRALARRSPDELADRVAELSVREQAELALRLPPHERLELLLHAPRPLRLVRALPDADLYMTVREVGPNDAMPVLALASVSQLLHLIDLESWRGDRFDPDRAGAWIALFLEAGEPALRRFLRNADDELLALLLRTWVHVEQIEYEDSAEQHGHGQTDAGTEEGAMTPDGYHRFSPSIPEHVAAIRRLLQVFYLDQPDRYNRTIWSSMWELPAEMEEQALHWRQSRLQEHGFPDWDEALSVYAAPEGVTVHPQPPKPTDPDGLEASRAFLIALPPDSLLLPSLDHLSGEHRERVLFEFLSVANRILVADGADVGDPQSHRVAIRKAAGYVEIALSTRGAEGIDRAAELLGEVPTIELFREGFAGAVELQQRALKLTGKGWASGHARALELLDHPIRGQVEGLLERRPMFFDPVEEETPVLREFRSIAELEQARVAVEMAEALGRLLIEHMGLALERVLEGTAPASEVHRFSTLLTTLLAWHATRGEVRGDPLPADVVADFLRTVASRRTAAPEAPQRALDNLLGDLRKNYGLSTRESSVIEGYGRYCLERLGEECGGLDPGVPLDPRAVGCLLLAEGD
jgi:hypothetical protein